MSRKTNVINNILSMGLTLAAVFFVAQICNSRYTNVRFLGVIGLLLLGAILAGFVCTLSHEAGHLLAGKKNGFKFVSLSVWFFRWKKVGKKTVFEFVLPGESAGFTEMTPDGTDNLDKRLKKMTAGALWLSFFTMPVGVIPLVIPSLPLWAFAFLSMFLPLGAATFFGNALPMSSGGARNDGAVLCGLKRMDDDSKVSLAVLSVQAGLYAGKTPAEIDERYYFDVPQLPEDSLNFLLLLKARYDYYLDKGDYENAKKTTERLLSLEEYFPKSIMNVVKADALYNACTFDFDEERADDLTYETEKYLNSENTLANVRIKAAYLLYVKKEYDLIDVFYKKGLRDVKRSVLSGYGKFEKKLLTKIKSDADAATASASAENSAEE